MTWMTEGAPQFGMATTAVIVSLCGENDAEKGRWGGQACENITNREDWALRKVCFTSAAEVSELEE